MIHHDVIRRNIHRHNLAPHLERLAFRLLHLARGGGAATGKRNQRKQEAQRRNTQRKSHAAMIIGCMPNQHLAGKIKALPEAVPEDPRDAPTLFLMHASFVLAGFGTMLLGPILPILAVRWHLRDADSGLLLMAQFCGATVGGLTTSPRLRNGLMLGLLAAALGFFAFALAPGLPWACAGLVVGGFGVGRVITTVNIIAGARYTRHRASALSRLNFSWSLGALLSPLSAAWLAPHLPLPRLLATFALCFFGLSAVFWLQRRHAPSDAPAASTVSAPSLPSRVFLYFLGLLFLYGGLETCLSGWLTTYALRYGQHSLVLSEYTMVLLLCGLTAGRALGGWLLLRIPDRTLQRIALVLVALLTAGFALAHHALLIAILAVVIGVCLAPIFPATFALLMAHRPSARQAGIVIASSGLGAAGIPWLMGIISTRTGSLQVALALPVAAALAMLLLSAFPASTPASPASV